MSDKQLIYNVFNWKSKLFLLNYPFVTPKKCFHPGSPQYRIFAKPVRHKSILIHTFLYGKGRHTNFNFPD